MLDIPTVKAVIFKCNPKCKKPKTDIAATNTTEILKTQIFKELETRLDLVPCEAEYWLSQAVRLNHVKNIIINEISGMIDRPINFRLPEDNDTTFGDIQTLYSDMVNYGIFIIYHDERVPNKHYSYIDSGATYYAVRLLENNELFFTINPNVEKDDYYFCITGKILYAEKVNRTNSQAQYNISIGEREKPLIVFAYDKKMESERECVC